jgi:hypothetical protein
MGIEMGIIGAQFKYGKINFAKALFLCSSDSMYIAG